MTILKSPNSTSKPAITPPTAWKRQHTEVHSWIIPYLIKKNWWSPIKTPTNLYVCYCLLAFVVLWNVLKPGFFGHLMTQITLFYHRLKRPWVHGSKRPWYGMFVSAWWPKRLIGRNSIIQNMLVKNIWNTFNLFEVQMHNMMQRVMYFIHPDFHY